jgi:hypothetical protein
LQSAVRLVPFQQRRGELEPEREVRREQRHHPFQVFRVALAVGLGRLPGQLGERVQDLGVRGAFPRVPLEANPRRIGPAGQLVNRGEQQSSVGVGGIQPQARWVLLREAAAEIDGFERLPSGSPGASAIGLRAASASGLVVQVDQPQRARGEQRDFGRPIRVGIAPTRAVQ